MIAIFFPLNYKYSTTSGKLQRSVEFKMLMGMFHHFFIFLSSVAGMIKKLKPMMFCSLTTDILHHCTNCSGENCQLQCYYAKRRLSLISSIVSRCMTTMVKTVPSFNRFLTEFFRPAL